MDNAKTDLVIAVTVLHNKHMCIPCVNMSVAMNEFIMI